MLMKVDFYLSKGRNSRSRIGMVLRSESALLETECAECKRWYSGGEGCLSCSYLTV